jgi:V8-like Glu-specific endopeptidase
VVSGTVSDIAPSEPSTSAVESGSTGSGVFESEALPPALLATLASADPYFAPYERIEGIRNDAEGSFEPYSVIQPDTREIVTDTTKLPARTIVLISFKPAGEAGFKNCTGTMVGRDVVLTAGHCVNAGGVTGRWHTTFTVVPGRNTATSPFGTCGVVRLFSLKGWFSADEEQRKLHDLGAIQLDCTVGDKTGWLPMQPVSGAPLNLATLIQGYPCDKRPAGRQWVSRDTVREAIPGKLFYQNDTYGCMSGSPVLLGPSLALSGVHTNGLHGSPPWNSNNAGTSLTVARIREIQAWMGQ